MLCVENIWWERKQNAKQKTASNTVTQLTRIASEAGGKQKNESTKLNTMSMALLGVFGYVDGVGMADTKYTTTQTICSDLTRTRNMAPNQERIAYFENKHTATRNTGATRCDQNKTRNKTDLLCATQTKARNGIGSKETFVETFK